MVMAGRLHGGEYSAIGRRCMNRKTRRPRRFWLLGALALLIALGAAHSLLWRAAARELEQGWRAWVSLRRAQGWRVEHAPPVRGGWPLSATLTVDRLQLEGARATVPGGMALGAERVVLRVTPPRLDRLVVDLPGQQRLRLGATEFPFIADRLVATLPLEPDTPPSSAEVEAGRLRIGTPAGGIELRRAWLSVEGSASATEEEPALQISLTAENLQLPVSPAATALGRGVQSLAMEMSLSGPLPPGREPMRRAEAWRDGGGTLELRSATLHWGPVGAQGAATLALDEELQPMGAGTLRLTGAAEALGALAQAGLIAPRAAATATSVLPLLSRTNGEDGVPAIEVPMTLEERMLAVARIPVLRLAPLNWPSR
jgi:hypothetical protein